MAQHEIPGDLAALLRAKDEAQKAYDAARDEAVAASQKPLSIEQRVVLDLRKQEAWDASVRADMAYADALKAFLASQQSVAA